MILRVPIQRNMTEISLNGMDGGEDGGEDGFGNKGLVGERLGGEGLFSGSFYPR